MEHQKRSLHKLLLDHIRRLIRRRKKDPEDPFALVGAPLKPRPPLQTLAVNAKPE